MTALEIDIWSDIACPWCWVGKRRLEPALEAFEGEATVRWRAFELDPGAPIEAPDRVDYVERLAVKYGTDREGARAIIDRMVEAGRSVGLELRFDRIRPTSTFAAHRLLAWAVGAGSQTELKERLFKAFLEEGRAISDPETLTELVAGQGLDADSARKVLESDDYGSEVREDQALAARLGIRGVPFFVFDRRIGVSGAQPSEDLLRAMRRAVDDPGEATG